MIYLTCDVHQPTLNNLEANYFSENSLSLAEKYFSICKQSNVKTTFFYTGLAAWAHRDWLKKTINSHPGQIEIGGHTWNALKYPKIWKFLLSKTRTNYNFFLLQLIDIWLTKFTIQLVSSGAMTSWRTHAYNSSVTTYKLLNYLSVKVISDEKLEMGLPYLHTGDLTCAPINVLPDHEHLLHGPKSNLSKEDRSWSGDVFGNVFLDKTEWKRRLIQTVHKNEMSGVDSVILIHAECMDVLDNFTTFEEIVTELSKFKTGLISEASIKQ
jgi:hypothetical protein